MRVPPLRRACNVYERRCRCKLPKRLFRGGGYPHLLLFGFRVQAHPFYLIRCVLVFWGPESIFDSFNKKNEGGTLFLKESFSIGSLSDFSYRKNPIGIFRGPPPSSYKILCRSTLLIIKHGAIDSGSPKTYVH